jgi:hypothetical protein
VPAFLNEHHKYVGLDVHKECNEVPIAEEQSGFKFQLLLVAVEQPVVPRDFTGNYSIFVIRVDCA